ncbi:MAG: ATP-binding protein [Myxococcota bacterium]
MTKDAIKVLLVEDNAGDAGLFLAMLSEVPGDFVEERADRLSSAFEKLETNQFDVLLLDLSLPDSTGPATFLKVIERFPRIPIILLTGLKDQDLGIRAMQEGVQDYLVKGEVDAQILTRTIRYAIERKNTQILLLETQNALETSSKMAALGTMAGGVAHEINTPLAIISMLASLAKDKADKDIVNFLDNIEKTVARIARITRGLQTFSRDAQDDPLLQANVKGIVDETMLLCEYRFKDLHIDVKIDVPENIVLQCRPTQITEVLINLLNNATDAIAQLETKWISIEAKELPGYIEIAVTDSGNRISKEIANKLFHPFFTTKDVGKGTGLGLSVSKGIISAHQGDIFLDDQHPNTRFVMRFNKTSIHP